MGSQGQSWASDFRLRAAGATLAGTAAFAALAVHSAACSPSPFVAGSPDASTVGEGGSPPILVALPDGAGAEAAADACTPAGSGALGVLGCPCPTVGASACAGNAQRQELICQSGVWIANGRCPDGQLCNSTPGPNQGSCGTVAPQCAGATPGQSVCIDVWTAGQCDSDLLSARPGNTCMNQTCIAGVCTGECAPPPKEDPGHGAAHCAGQVLQACSVDGGVWVAAQQCPSACCEGAGCAELSSDVLHCGRCGHDCLGGGCQDGACQPSHLASGDAVVALAVDATNVYWTTATTVMQMPLAGGSALTLASGRVIQGGIAVDGTSVYWTDVGTPSAAVGCVMKAPIGGGAAVTLATGTGQWVPASMPNIAVDATYVYWVVGGMDPWRVLEAPLAGLSDGGAAVTLAAPQNPVVGVAAATGGVYYTTYGCTPTPCEGAVMKVPASGGGDGGAPVPLVAGQGGIGGLAIDSTSVYWTTQTKCTLAADGGRVCGGTVMSAGLDGGALATLAGGQDTTGYLAVDGTSVYWPTSDGIARVALDGGSVATLVASDPNSPSAVAQQAATLYWADTICPADGGPCTGALMKLAKP